MVAISVDIEGSHGLTWPLWRRWVTTVEEWGFAGLYRSDHFPHNRASLETMVSLAYLAERSTRLAFGPMVSPLSFRDPVILTWQALALDDLSGGRMVMGVGSGWSEPEHERFGYDLGDIPTRIARFEEGLEVISRLLRSDEPVSVAGRFYTLRDARMLPRPERTGGPPIMIGGKGRPRILQLVARHADIWNATWLTLDEARERNAALDDLLRAAGRQPGDVRRTLTLLVWCGRDGDEMERRLRYPRELLGSDQPVDEVAEQLRGRFGAIIGDPEHVAERLAAYAEAGVDEIMVQWMDVTDFDGIRIIAEDVLPRLK
jgi:alkanesulfonate monooxygenase SsuD/methylene tetrahydromethanopterin reductase-like flavin-dependent oxidoreductase (luciferase family)